MNNAAHDFDRGQRVRDTESGKIGYVCAKARRYAQTVLVRFPESSIPKPLNPNNLVRMTAAESPGGRVLPAQERFGSEANKQFAITYVNNNGTFATDMIEAASIRIALEEFCRISSHRAFVSVVCIPAQ